MLLLTQKVTKKILHLFLKLNHFRFSKSIKPDPWFSNPKMEIMSQKIKNNIIRINKKARP